MHVAPLQKGLLSLTKPQHGGRVSRARTYCVRFALPFITVVVVLAMGWNFGNKFRPYSNKVTLATHDMFRVKNDELPRLASSNAKSPFSPLSNPSKPWKPSVNAISPLAPAITKVKGLSRSPKTSDIAPSTSKRPVPRKMVFFDWRKCNGNAVCCRNSGPPTWNDHRVVHVNMMKGDFNPRFAVCARNERDIASNEIAERKSWKIGNTEKLIAKLSSFEDDNVVLINVGANFGWTTIIAAYAGFKAPKKVRERVNLLPYGLGHRQEKCELWAQTASNRRRDAVTVCRSGNKSPRVQRMKVENFQKVGAVYLKSLDSLMHARRFSIPKDAKVVMKFDVDGFEPFAIMGAKNFINKYKPVYIYAKFCRLFFERSAQSNGWSAKKSFRLPAEYLKAMRKYGYKFEMPRGSLHSSREVLFISRKYKK